MPQILRPSAPQNDTAVVVSSPNTYPCQPFLREERKVGRDGYVQWQGAWYGVPWT